MVFLLANWPNCIPNVCALSYRSAVRSQMIATIPMQAKLFEFFNGKEPEPMEGGRFRGLDEAPPVPTTSILTKTDGVVHWRGSVQKPSKSPTENIEVYASHLGLGVNPSVMIALADRLAQKEGEWMPFEPGLAQKWMYPTTGFSGI